jgi:alkylation response protein AidB-like acyl-CoA dehydrogenase
MMAAMTLDADVSDAQKQRAVSAAKSRVGKAARTVGQEAVQLHGGIGMTDELDVSHYFKRVTAIDAMLQPLVDEVERLQVRTGCAQAGNQAVVLVRHIAAKTNIAVCGQQVFGSLQVFHAQREPMQWA